jgi:polyphosphate kinase 2 (PPK2 family)
MLLRFILICNSAAIKLIRKKNPISATLQAELYDKEIQMSGKKNSRQDAEHQLAALQHQLVLLQQAMSRQQRGAVVVLEGPDAAGKGGIIRRLGWCLDPRWLHVWPTNAPNEPERTQHWLQRFWQRVPQQGHWAVFDRSWYGRVLVERVEQLAAAEVWQRAYDQINAFEQTLQQEGFVLVKIWLDISAETQLKRFTERYQDPAKQWKLTAEDVRNRARWEDYVQARDEMFTRTSTRHAPWQLIDANDKDQARLAVFKLLQQEFSKDLIMTPPLLPAAVTTFFAGTSSHSDG